MPFAETDDRVKLYYEETGRGPPMIFVHEFAGDTRSWEAQVRYFSRRFRCVTFNARGYPPSAVPEDASMYSQARACNDIKAVLDHLGLADAHIVGLSMGGFATLHFGLDHPDSAREIAHLRLPASVVAGSKQLVRDIQDHCKRATAPYKYPRQVAFVADLPKNVAGKLLRGVLKRQEYERKDGKP